MKTMRVTAIAAAAMVTAASCGGGGDSDDFPALDELQEFMDERFADSEDYDSDAMAEAIDGLNGLSLSLCDAVATDLDQSRRAGVEFDERAARGEFRTTELPDLIGDDEFSLGEADEEALDGAEAVLIMVESTMADRCPDVTSDWVDIFGVEHLFEIVRIDG